MYIFVDVDGVLNPDIPREGGFIQLGYPEPDNGYSRSGFKLKLHPIYGIWLLELAESTRAELIWGTTWQEYANEWVGKPLGLPEMPHLNLNERKFSENLGSIKGRQAWKYAGDEKFVYFDDEPNIGYCIEGSNGLHIYVDYRYGLMKKHIIEAMKFLKTT